MLTCKALAPALTHDVRGLDRWSDASVALCADYATPFMGVEVKDDPFVVNIKQSSEYLAFLRERAYVCGDDRGLVFYSLTTYRFVMLDANDGRMLSTFAAPSHPIDIVMTDSRIYVQADNALWVTDRADSPIPRSWRKLETQRNPWCKAIVRLGTEAIMYHDTIIDAEGRVTPTTIRDVFNTNYSQQPIYPDRWSFTVERVGRTRVRCMDYTSGRFTREWFVSFMVEGLCVLGDRVVITSECRLTVYTTDGTLVSQHDLSKSCWYVVPLGPRRVLVMGHETVHMFE